LATPIDVDTALCSWHTVVISSHTSVFPLQLDDEDSILPHKLQAALEHILDKRKELASEMPTGESVPLY
jgi:hypothetical protein